MTRILRTASLAFVVAAAALATTGCKTATELQGTPTSTSVAWSSGQAIRIELPSVSLREGDPALAISVKPGTGNQVGVTFTPFNASGSSAAEKQKATDEINNNLHMTAENDGTQVHIYATTSGTHSNALGAFVDVVLPAGFDGYIYALPGNGDISISGAPAGVDAETSLGNIEVHFTGQLKSTDTGTVLTNQGDITFDVAATSDISFSAISDGTVTVPNPLPSGWQAAAGNTDGSASFTANAGSATAWKLDAQNPGGAVIQVDAH